MLLSEQLQKDIKSENDYHVAKLGILNTLLDNLPKELLGYDWESVTFTPYLVGWSALTLCLSKDDSANTATLTAWLTSLFDDIKVSKPQWSRWRESAYIEANTIVDERELRISIYCYKTGQCKKVKITKEIPEEITQAHTEEEVCIVCAGEDLPEGAEILEE
jgi:hypothetical protein